MKNFIIIFLLIFSISNLSFAGNLRNTRVTQTLKNALDDNGKWNTIEFSDNTEITSAANYYLQLSSTANQVPGTATTEMLIQYNVVDGQEGFDFTPTTGTITIPADGVYCIIAGGQVGKASGSAKRVLDMWLKLNDTDIDNSGVRNSIIESLDSKVLVQNTGIRLSAGDTIKVYIAVDNIAGGTGLYAISPAVGAFIPSIILTMFKVGN